MGQSVNSDEDEATKRRNKFRQLLSKYSDKPLAFDEKAKSENLLPGQKTTTYMKLRELDRLHQRTEDELIEEQTLENQLLRQKLKVCNEYLSNVVDA